MTEIELQFDKAKQVHKLVCTFKAPQAPRSKTAIGTCELYEHRLALYRQKVGSITASYIAPGARASDAKPVRTGTKTPEDAFLFANRFLVEKANQYLRGEQTKTDFSGLQESTASIRDALDFVRAKLREGFTEKQWREILRILLLVEKVWDVDKPYVSLSASHIRAYITVRTEIGIELPKEFSRRPKLKPCKLTTAVNDLLMLATVFKKIQGETVEQGSTAMPFRANPFSWLGLPDTEKALREKPTAERYDVLMKFVDRVDPTGRLRLALSLVRWHGRRIGAVSELRTRDLRFTTDQMLETLRHIGRLGHQPQDGIQSESFAYEFPHGAVFYDKDHDKEGYRRLVPLCSRGGAEAELYLKRNPDRDPETPLLPSDNDPGKPITVPELIALLHQAEELARVEGFTAQVPMLYDSVFHGYRGLRATEMENMGHRPAHVNFIVGWTCKQGGVKATRYVTHSGKLLYAAVEGLRPIEVEAEFRESVDRVEEENAALQTQNAELRVQVEALMEQNAVLTKQMARMGAQLDRVEELLAARATA